MKIYLSSPAGTMLLDALRSQYKASILGAQAIVKVYTDSPVGVGEHPQHLEEIDKQIQIMVDNKDKLEMIEQTYKLKNNESG